MVFSEIEYIKNNLNLPIHELVDNLLTVNEKFQRWDIDGIPLLVHILESNLLSNDYNKRLNLVELIVKSGADINENGYARFPPLMTEINKVSPNLQMIALLIKNGANINQAVYSNNKLYTPLVLAKYKGHQKLIQFLIESGAQNI